VWLQLDRNALARTAKSAAQARAESGAATI
jgi:hypothetical protein